MANTSLNIFRYIIKEIDHNKIRDEGCEFLSRSQWPVLEILSLGLSLNHLGSCLIGNKGC